MLHLLGKVCNSNWAFITISIVVILTVVDSEFIKLFYGTDLDAPGSFHLSLFLTFIIVTSIINVACLRFVRINDLEARTSRPVVFRIAYSGYYFNSIRDTGYIGSYIRRNAHFAGI